MGVRLFPVLAETADEEHRKKVTLTHLIERFA